MTNPRLFRYLTAIAFTLGTTFVLVLLRDALTDPNVSLVYIIVVLVVAIRQGVGPSLLAALLTFLCFNFFLVQPYYTFLVADPRDVIDLIIYLAVAAVAGRLAADARAQADNARQRASELDTLYKLTSAFNQITDTSGVSEALRRVLRDDLGVSQAEILPQSADVAPASPVRVYRALRSDGSVDGSIYGTLFVAFDRHPSPAQLRLLDACAGAASLALQRIELAERAQRAKTFEEADQLKTAILHAVSHDLRTPITIIKTSASNLLNIGPTMPLEEREDMVQTIETEADQLDQLVSELLDMSRLKAGALQMNEDWNSLEEVAGDVAARIFQVTHQQRIRLDFPDDLPLVRFDYGLLLRALNNVVDNAVRYEPIDSLVIIRGRANGNKANIAVINHGPNVPAGEREHIMEPFYHGRDGHIGLGLAIADGIVEAHHGDITVEDTPGGGATFIIELPLPEGKTE